MIPLLLVTFLTVFALIVLCVGMGLKFFEEQKRKKVTEMLEDRMSSHAVQETNVLLDPALEGANWLKEFVSRFNYFRQMEANIQQAGLNWQVNAVLLAMVGLSIPGALLGMKFEVLMNPILSALAGAAVLGSLPNFYLKRCRTKRMAAFEEHFPEALDFLSRAMRAGHAFSISLEMLADESPDPLNVEFRKVFNEQNLGLPLDVALKNLAARVPLVDVSFFVSAVLLQKETGGNLAEILTKLAYVIRERFKLKGQVRAAAAHGKVTGTILTLMPVFLTGALLVVAPGYLQGMAADPDGKYLIGGSILGMLLGHFTIRKIVDIRV